MVFKWKPYTYIMFNAWYGSYWVLTYFSCFKCFFTPGEEGFEDAAGEDVVQDVDIGDEAWGLEREFWFLIYY